MLERKSKAEAFKLPFGEIKWSPSARSARRTEVTLNAMKRYGGVERGFIRILNAM